MEWTHVNMKNQAVTSELDKFIQKEMCIDTGKGVERDHWAESDDPRATQLFKLTEEERENLPSENLEPEWYMNKVQPLAAPNLFS